ncbi:uncharacterized protein NECHADRAFT_85464 [Fusarium vanettenii 77-13-4]|uniref:Fungal N-terminal domain-containing protein n=1 Tax=Fusarium vanettenii (strain ATCC MYA-4622 / CBS 123669 / FGSC 9596 / NRRL 45880 / 77-13-4) TaxID=660122 RepID=C7ZNP7_FUSV7|nr:uncharacterized protein NECHADRAFT_85464 [Fusarium vanettenii 77-13-4]EEU34027.1 hypothetical protein NECHADRAFT_85464 [Fusarium vanettenii 77-13-4]
MPDPLSVAGSAVGIVSLGIQVCQGLVWYFNSVQGRKQDIEGGLGEVQTLASIFYSLNDIIPKINQAQCTEATMIRQCLKNSEEMLLELYQSLIRLRGLRQSTTDGDKMGEKARMLLYPFRAGKLEALRESLRGLLGNLNLAINTTSLEFQTMNKDKVDTIDEAMQDLGLLSKDTNAGVQDLNTKMQENRCRLLSLEFTINDLLTQVSHRVSQVEVAVKDLESNITGELTVLGNGVTSVHQGLAGVARMLSSQSTVISQMDLPTNDSYIKRMELSRIQDQGSPLSCGPVRPPAQYRSKNNSSSRLISPMCNCKRKDRSSGFSFAFCSLQFEFKQQIPGQHRESCKFFGINSQTERRIKAQFPIKLAWLSHRMTVASVDYTIGTSALGCSVRYRNVVPRQHSPVRKVLLDAARGILASRSTNRTIQLLEYTGSEILSLYRDGRASPSDRDQDDRCHTEMFIETFVNSNYDWKFEMGLNYDDIRKLPNKIWLHDSVLAAVLRTLQTLDAVVLVDDIRFCIDSNPFFNSNLTVSAGALEAQPRGRVHPLRGWHGVGSSLNKLLEMQLSAMTRAIVARSLNEVKRCLGNDPEAATETVDEFNVLHLCSAWPEGLRFFLTTKARNLIDCEPGGLVDLSALNLAIEAQCAESLDILMRAGSRFKFDDPEWEEISPEFVEAVARWLFQRRVQLFQSAQEQLEDFEDDYTSDSTETEARLVYENLTDKGISVPPALEVDHDYSTVYHSPWVPFDHFPILFKAGFRNHSPDFNHGLTPIMIWRFSAIFVSGDCLRWLREKGFLDQPPEDPCNLGLNVSSTGWHYLAAMSCFQDDSRMAWTIFPDLSQSSARDDCICWCIPGGKGCSPMGSVLKAYADCDRGGESDFWAGDLVHILCSARCGDEISVNMSHFVRFLTFEALKMTHTCCHFGVLNMERLEIVTGGDGGPAYKSLWWHKWFVILGRKKAMIKKVRAGLWARGNASLLDSLMEEFDGELQGTEPSPETLKSFLNSYWRQRMAQLFHVDEESVNDVKTYKLPERAQRLLGPRFNLRGEDCAVGTWSRCHTESDVEDDSSDETCSESEVEDESELGNDEEW